MVYLIRREHFNAAHRIYNDDWSDEKNSEVFGKCANKNFHGHNYVLYVTVRGEPKDETGFIMDAHKLSLIIKKHVLNKVDHMNLNMDVDFLKGKHTSTENLAIGIWDQLKPMINECELHSVKLEETENNFIEYFGK